MSPADVDSCWWEYYGLSVGRGRSFLVPVGVALAALGGRSGMAQADPVANGSVGAGSEGLRDRVAQPLLALSQAFGAATGVLGHSSHSSHISHASHFSSSPVPAPTPTPTVPAITVPSVAASVTRFAASLTAAQEVPAPVGAPAGASGQFTASLSGSVLTWRLTLAHVSSHATAAYVHTGAAGLVGSRLFKVCGPCSSPASGKVTLNSSQIVQLLAGLTYINVGTSKNPGGEIRGQIRLQVTVTSSGGGGGGGGGHVSHASHASHASHSSHFSSG